MMDLGQNGEVVMTFPLKQAVESQTNKEILGNR